MQVKETVDFSKGPIPDVHDKEGAPFWEGTRRGEIRFPKCRSCNRFHWYPCIICPFCQSSDIEWQVITSQPRLFIWTCVMWNLGPLFEANGPYIAALVEFDEAPNLRLPALLVDCKSEELSIGMPLEVVFQRINDELTMPLFKPKREKPS